MIGQAICSLLFLTTIFVVTFNLEIREMGLASNICALLIVLGGTLAATLIAYPLKKLIWTARLLEKSFTRREEMKSTIESIVNLAHIYRTKGIRPLEQELSNLPPGLLKTGVELLAYRYSRDKIEQILLKEALCTNNQCETSHKMLYNMARLAPALGLAGTIISLIRVFGHISDPQNLIGYMAIALLSTFYGVVLANVCFVPLSNTKFLTATCNEDAKANKFFYIISDRPYLRASFGHYPTSDTKSFQWTPRQPAHITKEQRDELEAQRRQEAEAQQNELASQRKRARSEAYEEFQRANFAPQDHPYILKKQLPLLPGDWKITDYSWKVVVTAETVVGEGFARQLGAREVTKWMTLPTLLIRRDHLNDKGEWEFTTTEHISEHGKRFHQGVVMAPYAAYHIGQLTDDGHIYIGEGAATVVTAYAAMDRKGLFLSAGSVGSVIKVAEAIRKRHPDRTIVLLGEVGQEDKYVSYAREVGARVAFPELNDPAGSDFNDMWQECADLERLREQIEAAHIPTPDEALESQSKSIPYAPGYHDSIVKKAIDQFVVAEVNPHYAVIDIWGNNAEVIVRLDPDSGLPIKVTKSELSTGLDALERPFIQAIKNAFIDAGMTVPEKLPAFNVAAQWLKSPFRRSYRRVGFDPNGKHLDPKLDFNLWRDFAVRPSPKGSWSRYRRHLLKYICRGDRPSFRHLLKAMAWKIQNPGSPWRFSPIVQGPMGAGKSETFLPLVRLFGRHAMIFDDPVLLSGDFTGHLEAVCFLLCEEIAWHGDIRLRNKLFNLVMSPMISIHPKNRQAYMAPNMLAMALATNVANPVKLEATDRRFMLLEALDIVADLPADQRRIARNPLYAPILAEVGENGSGLGRMLYDLQRLNVEGFNPNDYPNTAGGSALRAKNVSSVHAFLIQQIDAARFWWFDPDKREPGLSPGQDTAGSEKYDDVPLDGYYSKPVVYNDYVAFVGRRRATRLAFDEVVPDAEFWKAVKLMFPTMVEKRVGSKPRMVRLPIPPDGDEREKEIERQKQLIRDAVGYDPWSGDE